MTIFEKIAKVQDEVQHIKKDADNPFFKSRYATYEAVLDAIHDSMRKNNLVHYHYFERSDRDNTVRVSTIISTTDQENGGNTQIESTIDIPTKANDPQAAGSAITYAKRYSLLAMLGLGTEDDDGNAASQPQPQAYNGAGTDGLQNKCKCGKMMVEKHVVPRSGKNAGKQVSILVCPDATMDNKNQHSEAVWL